MISNFYFWGWIHNVFFLLENFRYVATKKTQKKKKTVLDLIDKGVFFGKKTNPKSRHNLRAKSHVLPYLDNEFLLVAGIRQESPQKKF
jgi:hypothetical protein